MSKAIHHETEIAAPREAVWAALTERDRMAQWWTTKVEAPPAAVGALVKWTFGGNFKPVMEITELGAPGRLAWRCIYGFDEWEGNEFEWGLEDLGGERTQLRFSHHCADDISRDRYSAFSFNWRYYIGSLRSLCETGTGQPFQAS